MDPDKISFYLKTIGDTVKKKLDDSLGTGDSDDKKKKRELAPLPPMRNENMEYMEPDWEDLDRKADMIVARYAVVSAAMNILPMPFDVMGVTGTFAKMATELAGIYQVIVSTKRARQMGWAIASTTASVLGLTYAGSKLAKLIPGGYWIATAAQAPLVGAIAWAAGDALKNYFKQCRQGKEPTIANLSEMFASTLRLKLKRAKTEVQEVAEKVTSTTNGKSEKASAGTSTATAEKVTVSDAVERIAGLHELLRAGAITQAEFDAKKAELLSKI
jgi:uncharacterized protein (DUF697 family)